MYTRVHTADVASWTPVAWASRCASRDPTRVHQRGWCVSACTRVDISHAVDLRTLGWLLPSFFSLLPFLQVFPPLPPRLSPSPPLPCSRAFLFFPSCSSLPRPRFHRFFLFLCSPLLFCALKCSPSTFFRRHRATSLSANSPEVRTWEFCLSRISELLFHHPLFLRVSLPLKPRDVSSGGGLRLWKKKARDLHSDRFSVNISRETENNRSFFVRGEIQFTLDGCVITWVKIHHDVT